MATTAAALAGARVLVTGATGFLGANLVRALVAARADVHVFLRPGSDRWRLRDLDGRVRAQAGDLADLESVRSALAAVEPDVLFHLAAHGAQHEQRDRAAIFAGTVLAAHHVLIACDARSPRRIVYTGGSSEYGPKPHALAEDDVLAPITAYGAAKAAATTLLAQAARRDALPIAILRPFSIYGPWESPSRLVPAAIRAGLAGTSLPLTAVPWVRDYVFVDDVVDACLLAAHAPAAVGEIVNVGTGQQTSNHDVVTTIERLLGTRIAVEAGAYGAHASDTTHWVADTRKAHRVLGWQARHDLESGLRTTIDWTRAR